MLAFDSAKNVLYSECLLDKLFCSFWMFPKIYFLQPVFIVFTYSPLALFQPLVGRLDGGNVSMLIVEPITLFIRKGTQNCLKNQHRHQRKDMLFSQNLQKG